MRPLFSVHAGEYLVATYIEKHHRDMNVWLPSKDTGVDFLLTNKTNSKGVSIQVKFSKDFLSGNGKNSSVAIRDGVKAGGWWTFKKSKLCGSEADFWVLVLYGLASKDPDFVIIKPDELWRRYQELGRTKDAIQSYVWVTEKGTEKKRCYETRGLNKQQEEAVVRGEYAGSIRDLTVFLNNWKTVEARLS